MSKSEEMKAYLPRFFSDLREMQEIIGAEAPELEQINSIIFDQTDQHFIPTATWALERWERLLNIDRDITDDINVRRARIITQMSNFPSITYRTLERTINRYLKNPSAIVRTTPGRSHFSARVNAYDLQYERQIIQQLERMKPAHFAYTFTGEFKESTDSKNYYAQKLLLRMVQPYWDDLEQVFLDGKYPLDGSWNLNGYSEKQIHDYYKFMLQLKFKIEQLIDQKMRAKLRISINQQWTDEYKQIQTLRSRIGFFGMLPVYLDGMYNLDGSFSLDGYDNRFKRQLFAHRLVLTAKHINENDFAKRLTMRSHAKGFEQKNSAEKSVFRSAVGFFGYRPVVLNGRFRLDGYWNLSGVVEKEVGQQLFEHSLGLKVPFKSEKQERQKIVLSTKQSSFIEKKEENKVRFLSRVGFFDVLPIYLDGVQRLDGSWFLNGFNKKNVQLHKQRVAMRSVVRTPTTSKGTLTIKKDWWVLDGSVPLDGSRKLSATQEQVAI